MSLVKDANELSQLKNNIKTYFENLKPVKIGLREKIKVSFIKKLGVGANNLNFVVAANNKKFIFRLNMLSQDRKKTKSEFDSLKLVEKLDIAPKVWILDNSRKFFDSDFIVLDYIEGKELGKTSYLLDEKLIKKIVRLCIKFHSMPLRGKLLKLPKEEVSYENTLKNIERRYGFVAKNVSDKRILGILFESYENLRRKSLVRKDIHPLVFAHGDIQEHNIIIHKGKLEVIDFEGVGLTDPASEIAYIFTQFSSKKEFNSKQREIFLNEYLKLRKDSTLRERVEVFMPLKNFADLLWAIGQALRVKHKLMHKHYLNKGVLRDTIAYAQMVFGRCVKDGTIDKKYKGFRLDTVLK